MFTKFLEFLKFCQIPWYLPEKSNHEGSSIFFVVRLTSNRVCNSRLFFSSTKMSKRVTWLCFCFPLSSVNLSQLSSFSGGTTPIHWSRLPFPHNINSSFPCLTLSHSLCGITQVPYIISIQIFLLSLSSTYQRVHFRYILIGHALLFSKLQKISKKNVLHSGKSTRNTCW